MSRPTGQLATSTALLGMAAVLTAGVLIVTLCTWLLLPTEKVPSLQSLTQDELDLPPESTCDDRLRAVRRRSGAGALMVDSTSLIECPAAFDGRRVAYRGEAVAAVLRRGDRAWLQLNDDLYALSIGPLPQHREGVGGNAGIAVNVPVAAADAVTAVGGAHQRGDVLTVGGVFRAAADDDGGAPSILVDRVGSVDPGGAVTAPRSVRRLVVAALLLAVTVVTAGIRLRGAPGRRSGLRRRTGR